MGNKDKTERSFNSLSGKEWRGSSLMCHQYKPCTDIKKSADWTCLYACVGDELQMIAHSPLAMLFLYALEDLSVQGEIQKNLKYTIHRLEMGEQRIRMQKLCATWYAAQILVVSHTSQMHRAHLHRWSLSICELQQWNSPMFSSMKTLSPWGRNRRQDTNYSHLTPSSRKGPTHVYILCTHFGGWQKRNGQ